MKKLISVAAIIILSACASTTRCPECPTEKEPIEVKIPVSSCEPPGDLPKPVLPQWPNPPEIAAEEQIKAFYAEVVESVGAREGVLWDYIEALLKQLDGYR